MKAQMGEKTNILKIEFSPKNSVWRPPERLPSPLEVRMSGHWSRKRGASLK